MAHLTAIIDQITRMENSLVNILLETAVKLSTLTDANIFVMVDTAGGRKWAGRKSLRDEYVRGLLKPSNKDVEVTETIASLPQEEFSMGNLMGMASGAAAKPHPATPTPSYGSGQAVFPSAHQRDSHSRDSALGRMDSEPSAAKRPRVSDQPGLPSANSASRSQPGNNNIPASPPQLRRKSPSRDQSSQDDSLSPPSSTGGASRQTVSKNLKDEFNGEENSSGDGVVIKEELGRSRGGEENRDFEDEEVEPSMEDGGGGVPWGEVALAGPSGLQGQNSDANQPGLTNGFRSVYHLSENDLYLADQFLHGRLQSDQGCAVPYPYMASSSVHLFFRGWLYRYDKARRVHTRYRCTKRQGHQCCSGAISISSTPGNPLEVIREVPHNLDPEPDMDKAVEKVKAARMKAIFRQQTTGKRYVVYLETGKFDEYTPTDAADVDGSCGDSASPMSFASLPLAF